MSDYQLPAEACSWCSHPPHEEQPCTYTNVTTKAPCSCARGLRFTAHHITCTDGCTSPDRCTQPGETPCPCHQEDQ